MPSAATNPTPWVVLKYGGTSVGDPAHWKRIAEQVRSLQPGKRVWIVVSALSGVSNLLEQAILEALAGEVPATLGALRERHRVWIESGGLDADAVAPVHALFEELERWLTGIRLTREAPPRLRARILSVGELAASHLGVAILAAMGVEALRVDARELLRAERAPELDEEGYYLESHVEVRHDPPAAESACGGAGVVLTQGFIAGGAKGATCLLGRGGSDTSAALFAALLGAEELQIWTDVPGLFTTDPRLVPTARLIRRVGYREAQELAAMGAKVLHPRCLEPVASRSIPLSIRDTSHPTRWGTRIEADDEDHPAVTAVTCRRGVTLLSLSTLSMWREHGFLARAFAPFDEAGVSIDLIATSQSAVTVTLDRIPGGVDGAAFARLHRRLEALGDVQVVHPCAVVSVVGRRIRAALHELGPAMAVFQERPVHLVSDSAEDLNLSFVIDEGDAAALVTRLHDRLFGAQGGDPRFGPTWAALQGDEGREDPRPAWWRDERDRLIAAVADGTPRYVYHLATVDERARNLVASLPSVGRAYYAMKANAHDELLLTIAAAGCGMECVSVAEVCHARDVLGGDVPVLFTPNFCPVEEYRIAFEQGAEVVIDGPEVLQRHPEIFRGRKVGLRIDPGRGLGHHDKVKTAGAQTKFGQPLEGAELVASCAREADCRVTGLHAHVGSGVFDSAAWGRTGRQLSSLLESFPDVRWIDLGGGLGVPERPGSSPLDLGRLEADLAALRSDLGEIELRIEPGRWFVSEAGVLVAPVTQVRTKGGVTFIGLAAGMNALIRPALYGAWHGIHNLSHLDEPPAAYAHVVGPICESADVLGRDRRLPETRPGDTLLVENVGAYGVVMASSYNLRRPPEELVFR